MDNFFNRAEEVRRRWDVLEHPFYERWSRGELTQTELAFYAGQYRHAVVALADAAANAGEGGHAEEERRHIELWDEFVRAVGGDLDATPTEETAACVDAWADAGRDRTATLAALYAIESAQPAIAQTKLTGLVERYGVAPASPATRYFDVHATLDHAHAAQHREQLEATIEGADEERLLVEVERVLSANWRLLDGVEAVATAGV